MRPLVSSSVLYVDLLFSTSTTSTTPSSHGKSVVAMRSSWPRPQACAIEAILSTTTVFCCISIVSPVSVRRSLAAGTRIEDAGQSQHLRKSVRILGRPLARGLAVGAFRRFHQRVLRRRAFDEHDARPEQQVHLTGDALLRRDKERLDVAA